MGIGVKHARSELHERDTLAQPRATGIIDPVVAFVGKATGEEVVDDAR